MRGAPHHHLISERDARDVTLYERDVKDKVVRGKSHVKDKVVRGGSDQSDISLPMSFTQHPQTDEPADFLLQTLWSLLT